MKGRHRYQIMLRAPRAASMIEPLRKVLGTFPWPKDVEYAEDVDALSLL